MDTWTENQLLAQLIMVGGDFAHIDSSAPAVEQGVGGVVFLGSPPSGSGPAITSSLALLEQLARERLLTATDEEGGTIARLTHVLGSMPSPRQMAEGMSAAQVKRLLAQHGSAMVALGVDMDLAPVLDTASPTDTIGLEGERSFSENGATAAAYGLAYIDGLRAGGVLPVAKHFPGLGHANGNTDIGPATVPALSQLAGDDLIPFQRAINGGVRVVMMSNAVEPDWGTTPASLNPAAYRYLRSMGFTGVILTDSLDAGAIAKVGVSGPQAVVRAIEAGADMAMITLPADFPEALANLEQAVSSGKLSMVQVRASVQRILSLKDTVAANR